MGFISDMPFSKDLDAGRSVSGGLRGAIKAIEDAEARKRTKTPKPVEENIPVKENNDEAIGKKTRYTPVTDKETEIRSNMAFKKGGLVVRGQGAVIRKKKAARIC